MSWSKIGLNNFPCFFSVTYDGGCPGFPTLPLIEFVGHAGTWYKDPHSQNSYSDSSDVCSAAEAFLPKVSTEEEFNFVKHLTCRAQNFHSSTNLFRHFNFNFLYFPDLHDKDVWIGLTSDPGGLTTPTCLNDGCNNLLKWGDDSPFIYKPNVMAGSTIDPAGTTDDGNCFFVAKDSLLIEKADCTLNKQTACQSDHICPVPHGLLIGPNWDSHDLSLDEAVSPNRHHGFTNENVRQATSGLLNGKVIMCGLEANPSVATCIAVKVGTNETVSNFPDLPSPVSLGSADMVVVDGGDLWFVGGLVYPESGQHPSPDIFVLDQTTETWATSSITIPNTAGQVYNHCAISFVKNSVTYVLVSNPLGTLTILDVATESWSSGGTVGGSWEYEGIRCAKVGLSNGQEMIVFAGGRQQGTKVSLYDVQTGAICKS